MYFVEQRSITLRFMRGDVATLSVASDGNPNGEETCPNMLSDLVGLSLEASILWGKVPISFSSCRVFLKTFR